MTLLGLAERPSRGVFFEQGLAIGFKTLYDPNH